MESQIEMGSVTKELFLKKSFGTAELNTNTFEFGHTVNGAPYVLCNKTNLSYILDWKEIIQLALVAGITQEVQSEH